MILLDTNVVSESVKPNPDLNVINWFDRQPFGSCWISSVSIGEIEYGLAILPDGRKKDALEQLSRKTLEQFEPFCVSFDGLAARTYAKIRADRRRRGTPIGLQDAQIAAIAITAGLTLATRNTKDFEGIEGLTVVDPWG